MKPIPMDKRILVHKVKWTPKRLSTDDAEGHIIDHVRLEWKAFFSPLVPQQTIGGNWRMFWDCHWSTKIDGKMPKFAVGDTIEFLSAPLYPKVCQITNITPFTMQGSDEVQHWEIYMA